MISVTISVDDLTNVMTVFDRVQLLRYTGVGTPSDTINLSEYTTISGVDQISSRSGVSDVLLSTSYSQYYFTDPNGLGTDWYISRYYNEASSASSGWSSPILGENGDIYYNPMYPPEVNYGTADKRIIDRIRIWIGDPIGLSRDYGEGSEANLHPDKKVYQLEDYGWPASINMYNVQYTSKTNPVVNGYEYLKFTNPIDTTKVTVSGVEYTVDVWYYTFRNSDRQIYEAYNTCFPPSPLNETNCTPEVYMLQTAYDLLFMETWEALNEDGAIIKDEADSYNPEPSLKYRADLLGKLKQRLDDAIKSIKLLYSGGVRID